MSLYLHQDVYLYGLSLDRYFKTLSIYSSSDFRSYILSRKKLPINSNTFTYSSGSSFALYLFLIVYRSSNLLDVVHFWSTSSQIFPLTPEWSLYLLFPLIEPSRLTFLECSEVFSPKNSPVTVTLGRSLSEILERHKVEGEHILPPTHMNWTQRVPQNSWVILLQTSRNLWFWGI